LGDRNAFSYTFVGGPWLGEELEKTSSHGVNFGNTTQRGTEAGCGVVFEDRLTDFINNSDIWLIRIFG
jgi:hypothetical protein